ncbi:MAG: cation transport ATPase, partial [Paracoccaceae bacterium]
VVLNGTFHVAAPSGYCVDTKASQGRADTAVVLIGRCTAGGQVAAALVSVTIGKSASGGAILAGPAVLAQFFASPDGRRALARDGKADHVQVVATAAAAAEGTLYLHLNDLIAGEYWRAITTVSGRLVTVSASGAQGAPLTPDQGRSLVTATVRAVQASNP